MAKSKARKLLKRAKETARTVGQKGARALTVLAPIAGSLVGGPLGAIGGTAVGAAASQVHQRHDSKGKKRARLKRALIAGAASTAASGAVNLLGGGGLAQSPLQVLGQKLGLGGGAKIPNAAAASQADSLEQQALAMQAAGNPAGAAALRAQAAQMRTAAIGGTGADFEKFLLEAGTRFVGGGNPGPDPGAQSEPDEKQAVDQHDRQRPVQRKTEDTEEEPFYKKPIVWLIGGALVLFSMSGKTAA